MMFYYGSIHLTHRHNNLVFCTNHSLITLSHPSRYWLSVGAQPSDPVQRILFRSGLLPPPPMVAMGRKGGPRDTRPVDPLSGRFVTPAKKPTDGSNGEADS